MSSVILPQAPTSSAGRPGGRVALLTNLPIQLSLLFFLGFAAIWAAAFFQLHKVHEQVINSSERDRLNLSRAFAEQVKDAVHGIDLSLVALREQWRHDEAGFHEAVLRQQNYFVKDVSFQVAVINADGVLVYSNLDPHPAPVSLADREHFKIHRERGTDELFISKPILGRVSNRWSIQFTRPILSPQRGFLGVVVMSVAPEYFSRFYDTINLGEHGVVTLLKSSGEILARSPHAEQGLGKSITGGPFIASGTPPTGSFQRHAQTDGIERAYTWRKLDDLGLVVVIGEALSSTFAPYYAQRRGLLIGAGTASALLIFFASVIASGMRQKAKFELALRQSHDLLFKLSAQIPGVIYQYRQYPDGRGCFPFASQAMIELYGVAPESVREDSSAVFALLHPDDVAGLKDSVRQSAQTLKPWYHEFRVTMGGELRWIAGSARPERLPDGSTLWHGFVTNVTERKLADEKLRVAAAAFEVQEGIMVTDARGAILRVNHTFEEVTGYAPEEVAGKTPAILKSGRQDPAFYQQMWESIGRTGHWQGEVWNRRKNGEIYPEWLVITAVKDNAGRVTHYVAAFSDITLRKKTEAQIRTLAFYDALTNLPNRRLLLDRAGQALAASARSKRHGALMLLDLDHFKTLNDTWGHDVGDQLLMQVAQRLLACVRERDTVARLGGDEFVVLVEELSHDGKTAAAQADAIGTKILEALNQPYKLRGVGTGDYHNTPSIGVSVFCGHGEAVEMLLKQADIALYQAKDAGRNTMRFYDAAMQDALNEKAALEAGLREALATGGFSLYYQPQVDHEHCVIGAEALLRWQPPGKLAIAPAQFIPVAEETGLILQIGQWVLETACAQLAAWAQIPDMKHLVLAVNVSARQFHQPDFAAHVHAALAATGADPTLLKLELTESMVLEDVDDAIRKMQQLREIGVRFAIDDFGTGYASLAYLKHLPIDQLKIDQTFVRGIAHDPDDAAIVQTIISMSHSLRMEVVAEGVEAPEQRAFLEANNCRLFQGYLFGRPMPLAEFETLFGFQPAVPH